MVDMDITCARTVLDMKQITHGHDHTKHMLCFKPQQNQTNKRTKKQVLKCNTIYERT